MPGERRHTARSGRSAIRTGHLLPTPVGALRRTACRVPSRKPDKTPDCPPHSMYRTVVSAPSGGPLKSDSRPSGSAARWPIWHVIHFWIENKSRLHARDTGTRVERPCADGQLERQRNERQTALRRTAAPTQRFAQNGSSDPHGCLPVVRSSRNFRGSCGPSVARRLPSLVSVGRATPTLSALHRTAGRQTAVVRRDPGTGSLFSRRPIDAKFSDNAHGGLARLSAKFHRRATTHRQSAHRRSPFGPTVQRPT